MIDIHAVQQQVVQFLTQRGHRETGILAQSYLIADGRVVGIQTMFAQASANWLFEETGVRVHDGDGRVRRAIGGGGQEGGLSSRSHERPCSRRSEGSSA